MFCQVGRIVDVLKDKSSHHNGFPVVDYLDTSDGEVWCSLVLVVVYSDICTGMLVYLGVFVSGRRYHQQLGHIWDFPWFNLKISTYYSSETKSEYL